MTSTPTSPAKIEHPRQRVLHIFTLCCFAITQPLLTVLEKQVVYLYDQEVGWSEIATLLSILLVGLPSLLVVVDWFIQRTAKSFGGYGKNSVIAFLFATIILSLFRPYLGVEWLDNSGLSGLIAITAAVAGAGTLVIIYEHVGWVRSWITFSSLSLIVCPSIFIWQFSSILRPESRPERKADKSIEVKNPVPVIFVVFDEFSGTTLMNEQMEVNSIQFPGFARLARHSTWYRKMTTVSPWTKTAVPAILSGRFPVGEQPPVSAQFPGNLFDVIESSQKFDMAVFEPYSRICSSTLSTAPNPRHSFWRRSTRLIYTLAAVYPRLIFSRHSPIQLPTIPRAWFGINDRAATNLNWIAELTEGLFRYDFGLDRNEQLQHFLRCLKRTDRPRFCFIHAVIPHYPWCTLPTGEKYHSELYAAFSPPIGRGELGDEWPNDPLVVARNEYRYRLQVGYMDNFIGQLLDRLQDSGIMDRCMLIVTADHGVAFQPGHSRRLPDSENLAEIMSVPLFVKLPGQTEGFTDDRNIESVDLLPTVTEVLGLELPEPVDGLSVLQSVRHPRKSFYFKKTMTSIEPDFPQLTAAVRRQTSLFDSLPLSKIPPAAVSHLEWQGKRISDFSVDDRPRTYVRQNPAGTESPERVPKVSRFICGTIRSAALSGTQGEIVIAVDGVVEDSGKSAWNAAGEQYFEFLLPDSVVSNGTEKVELYLVESTENSAKLIPLFPAQ